MCLIGDVFKEWPVPKYMVRWKSKKPCSRGPLDRQQGKGFETLKQSEWIDLHTKFIKPCKGSCIGRSLC